MSVSTNKILVPIGFSDQSIIALNQALNLARIKKSKLVLFSVIEESSIIESLFLDNKKNDFQEAIKDKLNNILESVDSDDIDIEIMIGNGKVYEEIHNVANMISPNLIIMGTNGARKGVIRRFIGSNAERVIRSANCPVITIKGQKHRDGCKNIVLPLDLEKQTKEKVTLAIEYARYWNATIRIVSVLLKDNDDAKKRLISIISQVKNFIQTAKVECTTDIIHAKEKQNFGDTILSYAKEVKGDLVMIMTKKEELALSNNISVTARYIINNSDIPVMNIRPKERKHITGPTTAF
ncbi:MAG: universal stress protein [Bacteroidota bacterium]|nr:universal stress protein [Bacteroidota bacterium]